MNPIFYLHVKHVNIDIDKLKNISIIVLEKRKGIEKMTEREILASFMEYFAKKECEKNETCEQCYNRCGNCLTYLAHLMESKEGEEDENK